MPSKELILSVCAFSFSLAQIQLDADGSGALEVEEWVDWWVKRCRGNPSPEKQQEVVARNAFKAADTDNSDAIDITELGNLCEDLGLPLSASELEEAMKLLDKGNNTSLNTSAERHIVQSL